MQGRFELEGLAYQESLLVYPVKEDTLLFFHELVPLFKEGKGTFLDMGCGAGLNGLAAASEGWEVLMVDREPKALSLARRNLELNGLKAEVCLSDLLEGVNARWVARIDLAAFNPPYLPSSGGLSEREGLPLSGHPTSYGLVRRFLTDVSPYLTKSGKAMVLTPWEWEMETISSGTELVPIGRRELEDRSSGERFNVWTYSRPITV